VNTIAPYLLTQRLLLLIGTSGRVINLSSAAQSPVNPNALNGRVRLSNDFEAYAQSKLALTMWSHVRAAFSDEFATASGLYFDNGKGQFASPHPDALDQKKSDVIVDAIEAVLAQKSA